MSNLIIDTIIFKSYNTVTCLLIEHIQTIKYNQSTHKFSKCYLGLAIKFMLDCVQSLKVFPNNRMLFLDLLGIQIFCYFLDIFNILLAHFFPLALFELVYFQLICMQYYYKLNSHATCPLLELNKVFALVFVYIFP